MPCKIAPVASSKARTDGFLGILGIEAGFAWAGIQTSKRLNIQMGLFSDREKAKIYAMMRGAIHAVKEFERKS